MTKRELIHLITVYDEETVYLAAGRLNISQPSLSQSISRIEKNLDTALFLRNGKHIVPTPVCSLIVERGREILKKWNGFEDYVSQVINLNRSEISIGLPSGLCRVFYYPFLEKLVNEKYPQIHLKLQEERSDRVEQLVLSGKLDLGIVQSPLKNQNIGCIPIYKSTNLLAVSKSNQFCCTHPYSDLEHLNVVDLSEIGNEPFAMINHHKENVLLAQEFQESGFIPSNIVKKTSVWNNLFDYIKNENCLGLIDENVVMHDHDDSKVAFYKINCSSYRTAYLIFHPGKTLSEQERCVLECARKFNEGRILQHSS